MIYNNQRPKGLFASGRLDDYTGARVSSAVAEAKALSVDIFESNSDEQIIDHINSKYPIEPLVVSADEKDVDLAESSMDARGMPNRLIMDDSRPVYINSYKVTWSIPVSGTLDLFELQPNTYTMNTIRGEISRDNKLILQTEQPADSSDENAIETDLNNQLISVTKMVEYINNDLAGYPTTLRNQISSAVALRKTELDKILKLKSALKVNIQPKSNAGPLHKIEVEVQKISPLSTKKEEKSAYIDDASYESVLSVVRSMGASMETSRASESKDEEALRDILLVGLNASIDQGSAGAETFRKTGKTDIAILFDNKAAFVAECKLWRGDKYATEGIDQLLGYLTWRDAKTSLIFFNKQNKNFSDIQSKVEGIFVAHPGFIKKIATKDGEWRFVFKKPDDDNRLITIHVFLFDVYDKKDEL
jgi:hypothetical protein